MEVLFAFFVASKWVGLIWLLRVFSACCGDLRLGVRLGSVEVSHGYCRHGFSVRWVEIRGESGRDSSSCCECDVEGGEQQKKVRFFLRTFDGIVRSWSKRADLIGRGL